MGLTDIQLLAQIFAILSVFASIALNIFFIYIPIADLETKLDNTATDVRNIVTKIDLIIDTEIPKIDVILATTKRVEAEILAGNS